MRRIKRRRASTSRRRRRVRRNPEILLGNPRRRRRRSYRRPAPRRRVRRNPGLGKGKIQKLVMNGVMAALGAAGAYFITNLAAKTVLKDSADREKKVNWLMVGIAVLLGYALPKLKIKNHEYITLGAVSAATINLASSTFGMKQYFQLAGAEEEELDKIIANLNVSGISERPLLGMQETDLLGIAEMMGEIEDIEDYS